MVIQESNSEDHVALGASQGLLLRHPTIKVPEKARALGPARESGQKA